MRWFHGGVPGLEVGDSILPPSKTGVVGGTLRDDRVYLAYTQGEAAVYASIRGGDLYECRAVGPTEPDAVGLSVHAVSAVVTRVVRRNVPREVAIHAMKRVLGDL